MQNNVFTSGKIINISSDRLSKSISKPKDVTNFNINNSSKPVEIQLKLIKLLNFRFNVYLNNTNSLIYLFSYYSEYKNDKKLNKTTYQKDYLKYEDIDLLIFSILIRRPKLTMYLIKNDKNTTYTKICDYKKSYSDAFVLASKYGYLEIVQELKKKDIIVNNVSSTGFTALMYACMNGYQKIVEELLKTDNIDINYVNKKTGNTALLLSITSGYLDIIELLIKSNAKISIINKMGLTALKKAIIFARITVIIKILDKMKEINSKKSFLKKYLECISNFIESNINNIIDKIKINKIIEIVNIYKNGDEYKNKDADLREYKKDYLKSIAPISMEMPPIFNVKRFNPKNSILPSPPIIGNVKNLKLNNSTLPPPPEIIDMLDDEYI